LRVLAQKRSFGAEIFARKLTEKVTRSIQSQIITAKSRRKIIAFGLHNFRPLGNFVKLQQEVEGTILKNMNGRRQLAQGITGIQVDQSIRCHSQVNLIGIFIWKYGGEK